MESEYRIIKYDVFNNTTQEIVAFETKEIHWLDARSAAIELATKWIKESSNREGIIITMMYGVDSDPDQMFLLNILSGNSLNRSEILDLLSEEMIALESMGYLFDHVSISNSDGVVSRIINEKHDILLDISI